MKSTYYPLVVFLLLCLMTFIGCAEGPSDATLRFEPEYDRISGFDIFPGQNFAYVDDAFESADTDFSPYFNNVIDASEGSLLSVPAIYQFVEDHADCYLDANSDCVRINETLKKLLHKSYIAAVIDGGGSGILGGTLNGGEAHKAICIIFVETIRNFAGENGLSVQTLTEAAVIHELGHGRADLEHLCTGINVRSEHNNPTGYASCVMGFPFPRPDCLMEGDAGPLEYIHFCGKCDDNLKNVFW